MYIRGHLFTFFNEQKECRREKYKMWNLTLMRFFWCSYVVFCILCFMLFRYLVKSSQFSLLWVVYSLVGNGQWASRSQRCSQDLHKHLRWRVLQQKLTTFNLQLLLQGSLPHIFAQLLATRLGELCSVNLNLLLNEWAYNRWLSENSN